MSFTHPLALLLLLLLIPVALLYWLRLRVPRVVVGTAPFWQQALAEERFRAGWQRWRTPVSLVLHMLTVILLALAAAGPAIPPPQRIVLILDNSATMRATDVQPSRFDAAKEAARRMIDNLRWCDEMAIVTTSPQPVEVQPLTSDRTLLRDTLDSKQFYDMAGETRRLWLLTRLVCSEPQAEPPAIELAVKVARTTRLGDESPTRIVLITDGCSREAARDAQKSGIEILRVGTSAGNRAITCFTSRHSKVDPTLCEAFVEVRNHSDASAQGRLELSIDGMPGPSVRFSIAKDGCWQHLFDKLAIPAAARLTAEITPGDAYPFDDTAVLDVPDRPQTNIVSDISARPPLPHLPSEQMRSTSEGGLAALYRCALSMMRIRPRWALVRKPMRNSVVLFTANQSGWITAFPAILALTWRPCDMSRRGCRRGFCWPPSLRYYWFWNGIFICGVGLFEMALFTWQVEFAHPLWLAPGAVLLLIDFWQRSLLRASPRRQFVAMLLRRLVLAAAVIALAGPTATAPRSERFLAGDAVRTAPASRRRRWNCLAPTTSSQASRSRSMFSCDRIHLARPMLI